MMTVEEFIEEWRGPEPFIKARTSGSTGAPKEIHLAKEFVRASVRRTNAFFNINSASRLHLPLSPDYIAGKMMVVRALEADATLTHETPSNTPSLSPDGDIHLLAVVPSQMDYLLGAPDVKVREYLIGGSAIPSSLRARISAAGLSAWESYGMTETASHVALRKVSSDEVPFTALPGITCALGQEGNLIINLPADTSGKGYMTLSTRDAALLVDPQHFLIRGRLDNVIITGGAKVHPEQVEKRLAALNWPFRYYVGGVPDAKWTNRVVLYIDVSSLRDDHTDTDIITDADIIKEMRTVLDGPELPREIIRLPAFRYTASGKLLRR